MFRSVLRNFTAFGAAQITERLVGFLFLIYAARKLGPDTFGQYLLIGSYVTLFSVTFTAGLLPVAVREIARNRDAPGPIVDQVVSLRLVLGVLAYAILLLVCAAVLPAETFLPLAAIAGVALMTDAFRDTFTAYHTAFERMIIPGAFHVANGVLSAACGAALLYAGFGLLALLAASALINVSVVLVWHAAFVSRFQRYRVRLAFRAWKEMLLMVAPVAPLQLAYQFNRLASMVMLSLVPGPLPRDRAVGFFGPSQQIVSFPLPFLVGLRRAIVPPVADRLRRGQPIANEFAAACNVVVVFLSFPILVASSFFATEILTLVFGQGYVEAAPTLEVLGFAAALWIASTSPESFLISYPTRNFTRFLTGAYMPLLINIALCLALIPAYGPVGAAIAILAARVVHLAYILHYCRAVLPLRELKPAVFLRPLGVLAITYAGCWLAGHSLEATVARATVIAAIALGGMVAAGWSELLHLRRAIFRRRRDGI